jgi:hydroxymethylbilane synthase
MRKVIRVATRPSLLATTQTKQTVDLLKGLNPDIDFEIITYSTNGDRVQDKPLTAFGGTGVFVKELEAALIDGSADIAIHSLKDVPSFVPEGLVHVGFPPREDPKDLFITKDGRSLMDMPKNFICGTGSPRRILQIKDMRPDAVFKDLRGNIDTRVKKLEDGEYDAIILAAAGLKRLGKSVNNIPIEIDDMVPAVSQGIISIECRAGDREIIDIISKVNSEEMDAVVKGERAFMKTIEGGCKFPLAAYGYCYDDKIEIVGIAGNERSGEYVKHTIKGDLKDSDLLGVELANSILEECKERGITLFENL